MTRLPNSNPSSSTALNNKFDRRNPSLNIEFPLIDLNGNKIVKERRESIEIHLKKIVLEEIQLPEQEFGALFNR